MVVEAIVEAAFVEALVAVLRIRTKLAAFQCQLF
jgi:hypothetical protein